MRVEAAGTDLGVGLAAAAAGVLAGLPAGVLLRELAARLSPRQPFPRTEVDLTQPSVDASTSRPHSAPTAAAVSMRA